MKVCLAVVRGEMSTTMNAEARLRLSLDGLSVGDAFGERFFVDPALIFQQLGHRSMPPGPWRYSDDTEMALAIAQTLLECGHVDQDALARTFADRYAEEPHRGYGAGAHRILEAIAFETPWQQAARLVFDGQGSMGNGAAMRAPVVGAWCADLPLEEVAQEARRSAEVTHAHPDGQAGAIAVAVAADWAWRSRGDLEAGRRLIEVAFEHTPPGETRDGIHKALGTPLAASITLGMERLGNGRRILSSDTVPFCLWSAARRLESFEDAMWQTVSALGDRDTTCAIVGGIVSLFGGPGCIPEDMLTQRETLNWPH